MHYYKGIFSGISIPLGFRYPDTAKHYKHWLTPAVPESECVSVRPEDIDRWQRQRGVVDNAFAEYVMSCGYTCDWLMKYNRIVIHGAALYWRGLSFIFTAPSGTGKTTQINHWLSLYKDEADVLNGDKPILEFTDQNTVLVHPSPWKGKEGMGRDDIVAPLGGIIFLRQDKTNSITSVLPNEIIKYLYSSFYSTYETENEAITAARMLEILLNNIPVWQLNNKGDEASAELTYKTLLREIFE